MNGTMEAHPVIAPEQQCQIEEKHVHEPEARSGFRVCVTCGEVLAVIDAEGCRPLEWVESHEGVNWFLQKQQDLDSQIAAVRLRAQAYMEQQESILRDYERFKQFLSFRYGPQVQKYMTTYLHALDKRSEKFEFGTIQLRRVNADIALRDAPGAMEDALDWCQKYAPGAVDIVRRLRWADLKKQIKAENLEDNLPWVEKKPERETFSFDTGIKAK